MAHFSEAAPTTEYSEHAGNNKYLPTYDENQGFSNPVYDEGIQAHEHHISNEGRLEFHQQAIDEEMESFLEPIKDHSQFGVVKSSGLLFPKDVDESAFRDSDSIADDYDQSSAPEYHEDSTRYESETADHCNTTSESVLLAEGETSYVCNLTNDADQVMLDTLTKPVEMDRQPANSLYLADGSEQGFANPMYKEEDDENTEHHSVIGKTVTFAMSDEIYSDHDTDSPHHAPTQQSAPVDFDYERNIGDNDEYLLVAHERIAETVKECNERHLLRSSSYEDIYDGTTLPGEETSEDMSVVEVSDIGDRFDARHHLEPHLAQQTHGRCSSFENLYDGEESQEKETAFIEEKDVDEKEINDEEDEIDLERPEKGECEDIKEFSSTEKEKYLDESGENECLGDEKHNVDNLMEEARLFEDSGLFLDHQRAHDSAGPRAPFQTPVKTSPIDMTFESGLEHSVNGDHYAAAHSSALQHSLSYELPPEVLERKLSRFSIDSDDDDNDNEDAKNISLLKLDQGTRYFAKYYQI